MTKSADLAKAAEGLTDEEIARLPGRLRRVVAPDPLADEWAEAKAARDGALEAAYALEDPDMRETAVAAARKAWAGAKTKLAKRAEG